MGGGGGKGKGGGGEVSFPPELTAISERLASLSEQAFELSRPGLELGRDILLDAGGRGGNGKGSGGSGVPEVLTPFIQQSVSATNSATSKALSTTAEELARRGISGSAAAQIMAQQRQLGDVAASQTGPNLTASFALPLLSGAAAQSVGQIAPGLSGLGGAGSLLTPGITQGGGGGKGGLGPILQAPLAGLGSGFGTSFGAGLASKLT